MKYYRHTRNVQRMALLQLWLTLHLKYRDPQHLQALLEVQQKHGYVLDTCLFSVERWHSAWI